MPETAGNATVIIIVVLNRLDLHEATFCLFLLFSAVYVL